jgi:hypothetical protein
MCERSGGYVAQCPLWVKSRHFASHAPCLRCPQKRTCAAQLETSSHKRTFRDARTMSAFPPNVLQNYFECPAAQHWFNINCQRAILIQRPVCLDSIIARSQRSEEFCNTFPPKADIRPPTDMPSKEPIPDVGGFTRSLHRRARGATAELPSLAPLRFSS